MEKNKVGNLGTCVRRTPTIYFLLSALSLSQRVNPETVETNGMIGDDEK
jgi:hypothetical protein